MKNARKIQAAFLGLALSACLTLGCQAENTTVTGKAAGFSGDITVELTWDGEKIVDLTIDAPGETPAVGGEAVEPMKKAILEAGSLEVDGVSGATFTSKGILNACQMALKELGGSEPAEGEGSELSDGTYEGAAWGFGLTSRLPVTVTITDGKIEAIEVGEENSETASILASVTELLIPRIIEYQSVGVDAITGATGASNGLKAAVLDALVQAGGDELALSAPVSYEPGVDEEYTVDIAIAGFGGAGATAAMAAAESGASVMVLEKAGKIGGTSAVTGGPMSVNEDADVEANGGEPLADEEAFLADWLEYTTVDGVQDANPEIVAELIDQSGDTNTWLKSHGFLFTPAVNFLGGAYQIYTPWEGNKSLTQGMFEQLAEDFTALGGQYMLETTVTGLLYDEEGHVAGIEGVRYDGTKVLVHADKVILAMGGFGGSKELMDEYLGEDWRLYGMAQNDGMGIRLGVEAGGATWNIDMPPMSHFAAPEKITNIYEDPFENDIPYAMVSTAETLTVNKDGNRFLNEEQIQYTAYIGGSRFYTIYSSDQIDILREQGFSKDASGRYLNHFGVGGVPTADVPMTRIDEILADGIEAGFIYKADTLEALGEAIGAANGRMSAETLIENVKAYNAGIEAGADALGKSEETYSRLGAINEEADYYIAVTGAPYIYSTCGGLAVDPSMKVIDEAGEPVPGLYAVGTDSMGVLFTNKKGYANYGGVAQAYSLVSGRIAGLDAAASLEG